MSKEDIYEGLQEVKSKLDCMSFLESDRGDSAQFGFYLVLQGFSSEIENLSNEVNKLREAPQNDISELFDAKK